MERPPRLAVRSMRSNSSGLGIALLSNDVALPDIRKGTLVVPLPDFPVPDLWIKAMVPIDRLMMPRVNALLRFIRNRGGGSDSLDARSVRSTATSRKK
jgi:DNA-binding transcriptional LysR family regulator